MQVRRSDVLVIGSGGAGVMAAVEAANGGASVTAISKEPLGYGDTRISMGAMPTSPNPSIGDSEEQFVEDMMHLDPRNTIDRLRQGQDLGLSGCADCRGCHCIHGINIRRDVLGGLMGEDG